MDINSIIITGRLGKNPDERENMTLFTVAVGDYVKGEEKTYWYDCMCFGKTAEYLNKYGSVGSRVAVKGKMTVNSYRNKDGNNAKSYTIMADNVLVLDAKKKEEFVDVLDDSGLPFQP